MHAVYTDLYGSVPEVNRSVILDAELDAGGRPHVGRRPTSSP